MSWIHVYRADLGALSTRACFCLLDGEEKHRAAGISLPRARREFVKSRAVLRLLLSRYTGVPPAALRLSYGPSGKPMLRGRPGVHFNVSHSAGMVLVAVSSDAVGVDLERVAEDVDLIGMAEEVFSGQEKELLTATPRQHQPEAFFSIWARKEAYLKATGQGFSSELQRISALSPAGVVADPASRRRWYALDLPAPPGFKAAVASATPHSQLGIVDVTRLARSAIDAQAGRLPLSAH